ncbi:hypothetical protein MKX01_028566 [Papaver californicum]|nr:hypothetical protein MKX01_028566 [Papaver californicum]
MGEFELGEDHIREVIETGFPPLWRRYKYDLRDKIRGKRRRTAPKISAVSDEGSEVLEESEEPEPIELTPELWEAAKDKAPLGMNPNVLVEFVENEKRVEKIVNNAKNAEARKVSVFRHTLGAMLIQQQEI